MDKPGRFSHVPRYLGPFLTSKPWVGFVAFLAGLADRWPLLITWPEANPQKITLT